MASELESAMADARRAGEGGPIDSFVERMAERIGAKATVKAVFGDPIERDGITIIPVAKVRYGFGAGAGRGPMAVGPGLDASETSLDRSEDTDDADDADDADESTAEAGRTGGSGSGGGGGMTAEPVGYLEIGPDGASFIPIAPAMPSPGFLLAAGATAALVLRALARLLRR